MNRTSTKAAPNLIEGPILRTLFFFALPTLGSNILQSINGSINAVWVGQYLGAAGLAATANANLIMFMMLSLVFGFGMATTILIGQNIGRRDITAMRRAFGTGLSLFLMLGIASAVLGWLISPVLLHVLVTPPQVYPGALTYLRVMFLGLPFALLTVYFAMSLRGVGDSMTPLYLQIPGMLLDIILNPLLIRGMFGLPQLGIEGAALATMLANLFSFLLMIVVIYRHDLMVRLRGAEWRYLLPEWTLVRVILAKGIPMGLQMIVVAGSAITLLGFVNAEGMAFVAAYGATTQIWTYIQMPGIAVGMAVSAMAAQNIGASRWDRVSAIARAGLITNIVLTGMLVIVIALFEVQILKLFLPTDFEALEIGRTIGLIVNWSFVLIGATMVWTGITRANGATLMPLLIISVAYLPGRLGSVLLLKPLIGSDAIWWSYPIGGVISVLLTGSYYRWGDWRGLTLAVSAEEAGEMVQAEADPAGRMLPNA
ncbi:MATE family efflux transporter [Sphingobium sufflavum]|uniref:MATE family efflux transporter n=1 Tax=Sphingobium sufflavum TaxID=1129547 RepID=UPI001F31D3A7|nr:MATE family efflux transporter [Sphingobium sufflavum]MCE7796704.1 MATE family efflux transporter [Sphingobium sufflavum]